MRSSIFILLLALITIHLTGCGPQVDPNAKPVSTTDLPRTPRHNYSLPLYQSAKAEVLDSLILDICGSPSFEFEDLHAPRNTFDSGPVEHLKLSELLRSQGFEVTDWGSGNWPGGPHISSRTLENGTCSCQVDKLYYDPDENGLMRITERILCLPL